MSSRRSKIAKTARNLAIADAALALARDRMGSKPKRRSRGNDPPVSHSTISRNTPPIKRRSAMTQAASRCVTAIFVMAKDDPHATTRPANVSQSMSRG